jgi:TonB-linked SusC/RagA family outer membrane protein
MMLTLVALGFDTSGQSRKIDLKVENRTILEIFKEIERKTEYGFFIKSDLLDLNKRYSVDITEKSVNELLAMLIGEDYTWQVINNNIVVMGKERTVQQFNQQAQNPVTGRVTDRTGSPLPGVTIVIKGTTIGTITDYDGRYTVQNVPEGSVLIFSFVGMRTHEFIVGDQTNINIQLEEDFIGIEEIVAIGYGTQKKANLTGAVSQVQMDKVLGDRPVTNVSTVLQGSIPGLNITGGSIPGTSKTINIRGMASINNSSGSPLVLIDNVPGSIDLLNPEDIESVSVLKDAASAAIYGARGAFGVVLITTKRATKNQKLSIRYNNNFGFEMPINRPEEASPLEYLKAYQEWDNDNKFYAQGQDLTRWIEYIEAYNNGTLQINEGDFFVDGRYMPTGDNIFYHLTNNKPQEAIFDKNGFTHTHNLSATGGSEFITYRMSFGHTDQDGPLVTDKDSNRRRNLTSYVSADINSWLTQSIEVQYAESNRSYVENSNVFLSNQPPIYPVGYMPRTNDLDGELWPTNSPENYLRLSDPSRWETENTRLLSRTKITPLKGLEGIIEYTYSNNFNDFKRYTNDVQMINAEMGVTSMTPNPLYRNYKTKTGLNALNTYATYNSQLNKHALRIMAGYNQETRDYEYLNVESRDLINPNMPSFSSATGITNATDTYLNYAIRSGFFRFNYNYIEKYLVEVNSRYDGSSKFPRDSRFGFFPSVSVGWQIAQEDFMDWSENWLNEFKLRASWGQLGNQNGVSEYAYIPTMGSFMAGWLYNGVRPITLGVPPLVSPNYTWETVETLNFGYDLSMFNNRLSAIFDIYQRDTKGMLAPSKSAPGVVGAAAPDENSADLRTKGWELTLSWREQKGNWRYGLGLNLYDASTVITNYDNEEMLLSTYRIGQKIGEIWGYVTDGFYDVSDFNISNWSLKEGVPTIQGVSNLRPGDMKYKDLKGDGVIRSGVSSTNPEDLTIIGNSTARYNFGANGNIGWKGFDLSVFLTGTGKRDVWIDNPLMFSYLSTAMQYVTIYKNQLDFWRPISTDPSSPDYFKPIDTNAYYPRMYGQNPNSSSNRSIQTKFLQSGAYLRIKNITLSYSVPTDIVKKAGFSAGKVFFSGENMFTFTSLPSGIDPERLNWGYPFYSTYSFGINLAL